MTCLVSWLLLHLRNHVTELALGGLEALCNWHDSSLAWVIIGRSPVLASSQGRLEHTGWIVVSVPRRITLVDWGTLIHSETTSFSLGLRRFKAYSDEAWQGVLLRLQELWL